MSALKTSARSNVETRPSRGSTGRKDPDLRIIDAKPPKLVAIIRECDENPPLSDDELTDRVIARLRSMGDDAWGVLRTAIRERVTTDRGLSTRKAERRIVRSFTPGDGTTPATDPVRKLSLDQLRQFCGQSMRIPGLDAPKPAESVTIAEWGLRAEALDRVAVDATAKASLYRSVMRTLRLLEVDTIAEALTPERKRARA